MRVTPSLPQRGKRPKGSLLDPLFFGGFNVNLMRGYHNWGMPERRGLKALRAEAPKSGCSFLKGFLQSKKGSFFRLPGSDRTGRTNEENLSPPLDLLPLGIHVKDDLELEGFAIGFLRLVALPELVEADTLDVPGHSIICVQGGRPCTG
jgi:hypothetical protein